MCNVQSYVFNFNRLKFFLSLKSKTSNQIKRIRASHEQMFNANDSSMNGILRAY